tara:strand:+ start:1276 stop:2646 length:1371 start_codon:yes stop_codon:yes gene_type:complete
MKSIVLFKNNLRYNDNSILKRAVEESSLIMPVFIYDTINFNKDLGGASKYWLYHSLTDLNKSLNNNLSFYLGDTIKILKNLIDKHSIDNIYCEEPFLEEDIKVCDLVSNILLENKVKIYFLNSTLLWKPKDIYKKDFTPYKVFTPFYKRGCLNIKEPDLPVGKPGTPKYLECKIKNNIDDLNILDEKKWYDKFNNKWDISEKGAQNILEDFINENIYNYKVGRDFPSSNSNSKLSPYIRFGLISIHRIWYTVNKLNPDDNILHFKSEIGWREFSYYLLYHFPQMQFDNLRTKFDKFEWDNSKSKFKAWCRGETGFPIIDAAMKELWETGYMHNRMRMITASFLVKNLLIDWRWGEKWFWDCLFDADPASNIAGWQWVAGTGADAAPYFRIFNPILQGEKFDAKGKYTLNYLPELKNIPIKYLQKPWDFEDGSIYIEPIINYKDSRKKALLRYSELK